MPNLTANERALEFATHRSFQVITVLGQGTDGIVWKTSRNSAVKAFYYDKNYFMELGCYQRLAEHNLTKIGDLSIPVLLENDDNWKVIEMEFVSPPCILDFGKAYLDREPEHSPETWEEHHQEQRELWEDRYNDVQAILWKLRQIGIYYRDAKPGNIQFGDKAE